jgi:hypothetical protein
MSRARVWSARRHAATRGGWNFGSIFAQACDLDVIPLNSRLLLWEEGAAMHTCVYELADLCDRGESRFFGLRQHGRRLATVELQLNTERDAWFLRDCRGPLNRRPDERVLRAARNLADLVNIEHDPRIAA